MSEVQQPLYTRDGDKIVPTGVGVSVWDPTKQGGSAVLGLAAQLLDTTPASAPMLPARLTFDLLSAVPMEPLIPRITVLRDGKRLQLTAIELEAEGRVYVRGTMVRVRTEGVDQGLEPLLRPFPEQASSVKRTLSECISVEGNEQSPGPGALWMRTTTSFFQGEPPRPLACVVAAADWGTTVAPPADPKKWTFANVDLSINLSRMPTSDWLLLDGRSEIAGNGTGYTHLRIGDLAGMFGSSSQTIFLDKRK